MHHPLGMAGKPVLAGNRADTRSRALKSPQKVTNPSSSRFDVRYHCGCLGRGVFSDTTVEKQRTVKDRSQRDVSVHLKVGPYLCETTDAGVHDDVPRARNLNIREAPARSQLGASTGVQLKVAPCRNVKYIDTVVVPNGAATRTRRLDELEAGVRPVHVNRIRVERQGRVRVDLVEGTGEGDLISKSQITVRVQRSRSGARVAVVKVELTARGPKSAPQYRCLLNPKSYFDGRLENSRC